MKKKHEKDSWVFPQLFSAAFSKDKDIGLEMRFLSLLAGTGMLVFEPIARTYIWFSDKKKKNSKRNKKTHRHNR